MKVRISMARSYTPGIILLVSCLLLPAYVKAEQPGCMEGDCVAGSGTYVYPDGSKYIGEFKDRMPEGKGRLYYSNKSFYSGEFKKGKKNGDRNLLRPEQPALRGRFQR